MNLSSPEFSNKCKWILDSGATSHMSKDINLMDDLQDDSRKITLPDDRFVKSKGIDTVEIYQDDNHLLTLKEVLYVPELNNNLISHESIGRAIYVLNIVDDFSRKIFPKFLKSKLETFAKLKEFIELIENIKESISNEPDEDKNVYNLRPTPEQGFYYESSLSDEDTSQDDTTSDPTYHPGDSVMKVDSLPIIPTNYEEAINSPDKEKWLQAMKGEIVSLKNHKVWDVLPMTKTIKPIKSKWVFSIKNSHDPLNPIYKARLVAVGCSQKFGVEYSETYSPVIKSDSLRTLIVFAAMKNLHIHHFDIETAFLYGAFDNVLHSSILRALRKSDCPKNVHDLIRSFLAHRSVRLSVNGCTVTRRVSKGCPQGSVLGPFLWNIVFDELLTLGYKNCVYPQAYADDLVVVISGLRHGQLSKAQHAIDLITNWCGLHKLELSVNKCQAMFVQKPRGRIRMLRRDLVSNGQVVQWSDSIRVLGVRFDNRLTFHQHVAEVCSKVRGKLPRLSAAANFNFGFGFRALRMLYLQVVIPVLAYASPVWFPNLIERSRKLLLSTQRFFLVLACRAFKTTNNSYLISLSRVLPLDLEIGVKTQLYLKKYGYVDADFPVEPPPSPQPLPYPPFFFLPSNIPELPPEVTYYTDGSKTNDGVGAVFQAEAFGLIKALENASELPINTTIEVLLDNLSVVNSVLNCRTGNFLINRALLLISQLNRNGNRCSIRWIKGHSGTVRNDVADELAKAGAGSDLPSCYRLAPLSYLESTARKLAWAAWQSRFSSTTRPICTRFGLTPMSLLDKKYAFIVPSVHAVVGLLSGHTWTDSFSHKMGFIDDPTCLYCDSGAEETLEHILLECDSLDSLRTRLLFIAGKELGHTPRSLRDFIHSKSTWHACVDFLLASDRLKLRIREEESEEVSDSSSP
ncbi:hypothetical protein LAZ67_12001333 [Cordylochernes scorpioides]|uniref:RNase H type-1 domain-containing protein n=1 Tax=Cordylochernes scorpioides TaxID=51811 RepID=A0ABY6L172_9ARAC|nr:hypothetical protein LAZ67_12001333 [Cordylochernes scorpioides]